MNILTDWSLLAPFVIKGTISSFLVAIIGYGIANIHAFHDPEDDE